MNQSATYFQGLTVSGGRFHAWKVSDGDPNPRSHGHATKTALCGAMVGAQRAPFNPDSRFACKRCARLAH